MESRFLCLTCLFCSEERELCECWYAVDGKGKLQSSPSLCCPNTGCKGFFEQTPLSNSSLHTERCSLVTQVKLAKLRKQKEIVLNELHRLKHAEAVLMKK